MLLLLKPSLLSDLTSPHTLLLLTVCVTLSSQLSTDFTDMLSKRLRILASYPKQSSYLLQNASHLSCHVVDMTKPRFWVAKKLNVYTVTLAIGNDHLT